MTDSRERLDFSPYLTGVYLAVNAVRDCYLVVDGPNCVFFRIPQISPNHDWLSDLVRSSGLHRVVDTDATPTRVSQGNPALLLERLRQVDTLPDCAVILLTPMTHVAITGRQYPALLDGLDPPLNHPVFQVTSDSLEGDWLDGYAAVLTALASGIPLESPPSHSESPRRVALVGHLHHRLEADVTADVEELQRLVTALGLEWMGAWPQGGSYEELAAVSRADLLLSLPYAREAGRVLAERTGATLLELALPIGLEASCTFIRQLAEATGREDEAEAFLDQELGRVVPQLEWVLAHELLGRRVLVASDPHLVVALRGALTELGCSVRRELVYARDEHGATPPDPEDPSAPAHQVSPTLEQLLADNVGQQPGANIDLAVGCSFAAHLLQEDIRRIPLVEVGFPQYHTHALYSQPLLGFNGVLCLVSRLVTALRQGALRTP